VLRTPTVIQEQVQNVCAENWRNIVLEPNSTINCWYHNENRLVFYIVGFAHLCRCVAAKKCWNAPKKLTHFQSYFKLNFKLVFDEVLSLSLRYKQKHEKSVGKLFQPPLHPTTLSSVSCLYVHKKEIRFSHDPRSCIKCFF